MIWYRCPFCKFAHNIADKSGKAMKHCRGCGELVWIFIEVSAQSLLSFADELNAEIMRQLAEEARE